MNLSVLEEALILILTRDTAFANELDIFRAVCRWIKKNQDELEPDAKTNILSAIRYQLMDDKELSEVNQSELVCSDAIILDIIKSRSEFVPNELDYRGRLEPNVNLAPRKFFKSGGGTMSMLDHPSNINYIEMKLICNVDSCALLFGDHKDSRLKEVPIKEGSATSVNVLLKYIYSGRVDLSTLESKVIVELLILSNVYRFSNLQFSLSEYLLSKIDEHNASSLFVVGLCYQIKELEIESLNFIDIHSLDVLQSEDSFSLTPEALLLILNRDMVYANDLDIFRAVCHWIKKKKDEIDAEAKTKILSAVRYQLMDDEELSEVRRSELVSLDSSILDVIKLSIESLPQEFKDQGRLEPNVNFAGDTPKEHFQIDGGTMIMLDHPSKINYIEMELSDKQAKYGSLINISNQRFNVILF
ncbi:uncharacterized protein LOC126841203 [Adelges cooleyi]|uniref:uncharacterized protein LOC126841203 n=1 Tax=Adelges cooleyi TaxID=133065 RepID=UPI00218017EE|nr:uncharacterized protein LOC126841203 [Adelges cooleyi]